MPRTAKKPTNASAPNAGQSAAPVTAPRPEPITVPTGLPYGEAKALADAQRTLPVSQPPGSGPVGAVASAPTGAPAATGTADAAIGALGGFQHTPIGLGAPSARPNEPVTTGLPTGPGPGPEALAPPTPQVPSALVQGAAVLNALGDKITPAARQLRDAINASIYNQAAP